MIRSALFGAVLVVSVSGCATVNLPGGDDGLVERVRAELALDPTLNSSRITVTENDGEIILSGFADSLEEINVIRDVVTDVEGVVSVQNDVILEEDGNDVNGEG